MRSNLTFQEVEVVILALPPTAASPEQIEVLSSAISNFIGSNDNPSTSAHLKATSPDRVEGLVQLLTRPDIRKSTDACILVLKALKILGRRQDNRQRCNGHTFQTLMPFLSPKQPPAIASEAANATLNLAYEAQNVQHLVKCKGEAALLQLLTSGQEEVLVNAAGAVQTVCYQKEGREAVRNAGGVAVLVRLLQRTQDVKVLQRAVGALHNLSSEADAVKLVRSEGGIPALADLLQSADAGTSAAAVGALQNVSLEMASCQVLLSLPLAVESLAGLLVSEDVQVAACAAGVLLNISKVNRTENSAAAQQESPVRAIAGVLYAVAIYSSLFRAGLNLQTS